MKSKRWGFAAITAAIVATLCVAGPVAAHADPAGPTVTSVDRSGAQPVVTIDWGAYIDAPVGVLESVDGYKLGTPADMTTVVDDYGTSPGLRSYRAAACYSQCDLDSIQAGTATLVQGDWLRPDVGDVSSVPAPETTIYWTGTGFSINWEPSEVAAPAIGIHRNGDPIAVAPISTWTYLDVGPFTASETFSATGCYADCTLAAVSSGFALQSQPGPATTFNAAVPPIPTSTVFNCPGDNVGFPLPLDVGVTTSCRARVTNQVFALDEPTGGVQFDSDDNALVPSGSCVLQDHQCDIDITPNSGSGGSHTFNWTYGGDGTHTGSTFQWNMQIVNEPTTTAIVCVTTSIEGAQLQCAAIVRGAPTTTPWPDGGAVVFTFDRPGLESVSCPIAGSSCAMPPVVPSDIVGPLRIHATYTGDSVYGPSESTTTVTILQPTSMAAKPAIANLISPTKVNLTMAATLTDALDHSPIAGETVRFVANGTTLCTGVTDASGLATCSGLTEVAQAANGYKAFYDGATYKLKSSTSGAGVRL